MKRIQQSIIGLVICLSLFLNIERLDYVEDNVINISSFVYVLGIVTVVAIIAFRPVWRLSKSTLVIATLAIYLFCKTVLFTKQPLLGGIQSYVSFTEVILLCLLIILARRFARALQKLEELLAALTLPDGGPSVRTLEEAAEEVKAEMHLSRRHERSLSVVVVDYKCEQNQEMLGRIFDDLKSLLESRYAASCFARLINSAIRRTDRLIEVRGQNRFIVLCHETDGDGLSQLLQRIQSGAENEMGADIAFGTASFPDEALTFEELLNKAETRLDRNGESTGSRLSSRVEKRTSR
ncbi:MAG: hypothetical protein V3V31_14335 [Methylococcales bacterium]